MKKVILIIILSAFCLMFLSSFASAVDSVGGSWCVSNDNPNGELTWGWAYDPNVIDLAHVPKKRTLKIYAATFNFYPSGDSTIGRVYVDVRDGENTRIYSTQTYLEPKETTHMTFPGGIIVKGGGFVSLSMFEGQGTICVDAEGHIE